MVWLCFRLYARTDSWTGRYLTFQHKAGLRAGPPRPSQFRSSVARRKNIGARPEKLLPLH